MKYEDPNDQTIMPLFDKNGELTAYAKDMLKQMSYAANKRFGREVAKILNQKQK